MSVNDYATYQARVRAPWQRAFNAKTMSTTVAGRLMSQWNLAAGAAGTPSTAAATNRATAGALGQFDSSGTLRLVAARIAAISSQATLIIADRLAHSGGISGTGTGTITTNLPSAALTRSTSGDKVWAGVEIYTQIGTTAQTATVSYTNDAGTSGRTSQTFQIGATNFREAGRMLVIPLASGDKGVRAVASISPSGSTGTAGNYGITLFKPLYLISAPINPDSTFIYDLLTSGALAPAIDAGACLMGLSLHSGNNQTYAHDLLFAED